MEIHLLLEGEQVGPLSEAQVREYMDQGLVTSEDLASHVGLDDWMPLERVLARIPTITPAPPAVPAPVAEPTAEEIAEPALADASPAPDESSSSLEAESSFLYPTMLPVQNEAAFGPVPTESLPSLTATQKTRRKLGKIVIQPILPLETPPPQKKKSGKTAITLEPMRSTISLPAVTGHQPRKTHRTGKVSLRITPQPGPELPGLEPSPEPETELVPIATETATAVAPIDAEPIAIAPTPEPASSEIAPPSLSSVSESEAEQKPDSGALVPAEVTPTETVEPPLAAAQKPTDPAPVFSVLPKDSPFVPPLHSKFE